MSKNTQKRRWAVNMDEEYEGWTFAQKAAFNCCIDYLVMLIEKYGKEVLDEISEMEDNIQQ